MPRKNWISIAGKDHKHQRNVVIFLLFAALVLLSSVGLVYRFKIVEQQLLNDIEHHASRMAASLDDAMVKTSLSLSILATQFQTTVQGNPYFATRLQFRQSQDGKRFQLSYPTQLHQLPFGDLTGAGPQPTESSLAWKEAEAALLLTPVFQEIEQHDVQHPWLYYTSASGFIYLYPSSQLDINNSKVTGTGVLYNDKLLEMDFFRMVRPEHNARRQMIWTPIYEDSAGKGKMITASMPVYLEDKFLGALSIDISMSYLLQKLQFDHLNETTMLLMKDNGRNVLTEAPEQINLAQLVPAQWHRQADQLYFPLSTLSNGWQIVLQTNHQKIHRQALAEMLFSVLALLLLLTSVLLLWKLLASLAEIKKMSVTDGLTKLYNRRHFNLVFTRELKLQQRSGLSFGLIMLDIDYFKKYNDHYGHQGGDLVLQKVATCLKHTFRRDSDAVFRVGGEEFCLLILAEHAQQLCTAMDMLCQAIRAMQLPHTASPTGRLAVSVGGVWLDGTQRWDTESAYSLADQALYQAKQQGRDGWRLATPEPAATAG